MRALSPRSLPANTTAPTSSAGSETGKYGPDFGIKALNREALPSPSARLACTHLLAGTEGDHDIHLRELGRRGMHRHRRLESIDDSAITFGGELSERLATV